MALFSRSEMCARHPGSISPPPMFSYMSTSVQLLQKARGQISGQSVDLWWNTRSVLAALEYFAYSAEEHGLFLGVPGVPKLSQNKTHGHEISRDCRFSDFYCIRQHRQSVCVEAQVVRRFKADLLNISWTLPLMWHTVSSCPDELPP